MRRIIDLSLRAFPFGFVTVVLAAWCFLFVLIFRGCGFLENQAGNAVSDIRGWDLSACVESGCGRETCFDLFRDNEELILGGRTVVDVIIDNLTSSNGEEIIE